MTVGINIYFSLYCDMFKSVAFPVEWVIKSLSDCLHGQSNHCSAVFIWVVVFQIIQRSKTISSCLLSGKKSQASLNSLQVLALDAARCCRSLSSSAQKIRFQILADTSLSWEGRHGPFYSFEECCWYRLEKRSQCQAQTQIAPASCSWTWSRSASATSTQILFLGLLEDLVVMSSCLF